MVSLKRTSEMSELKQMKTLFLFTAIVEHPANTPRVMKKGESGGGCYNANKIVDCILQATGIQAVVTGCLTKAAALQVAKKYIPYVGYAVALADFANCMGWTDW